MNKAFPITAVILMLLSHRVSGQASSGEPPTNPTVDALVKVADDIKLPAKEPGVLTFLTVKEGSQVRKGQEIAKIDDREIQIQMEAAQYGYDAAVKKFQDDIDIKYADAGAAVAEADYKIIEEAIDLVEKSITETDRRRAKLEWEKMTFAAAKARKERELARLDALAKHAELKGAKLAIDRRVIKAPFDGVVEEVSRNQEEWVNPGDTILRLFRMDTMRVEGAVNTKHDLNQLIGCTVTVEVEMAAGSKPEQPLTGRITTVSPSVRYDEVCEVTAEVPNWQKDGQWVLRDNMPATMTIYLGTGGKTAETASRPK
jgi:multidrug efflux pump subunit AcrA (membrane-fusion protein)